jgi:ribonuclease Z
MKIKFLGTSSGKTSLNRFHSSFLISSENYNLLVDCGDGISKAILTQNIDFNSIDSVLFSHFHPDHFSGLPSIITQMKLSSRKNELKIFVHSSEKDFLEDFIFHSYLFRERLGFNLNVTSFDEENIIEVNQEFSFVSKLNSHLAKYRKYDYKSKLSFVSLSFLFKDDENSCIYSGDVGAEDDLYLFNHKVDWFIAETTHVQEKQLLRVLDTLGPSKLILTHIGDDYEILLKQFLHSLPENQKSRIILAFDGFVLEQ